MQFQFIYSLKSYKWYKRYKLHYMYVFTNSLNEQKYRLVCLWITDNLMNFDYEYTKFLRNKLNFVNKLQNIKEMDWSTN